MRTIQVTSTGFNVGMGHRTSWHLSAIPKRPFGTPGKVQEEYEEYLDAKQQGLRLVMAFELADMIGALAGCLQGSKLVFDLDHDLKERTLFRHVDKPDLGELVLRFMDNPQDEERAKDLLANILMEGFYVLSFRPMELLQQAQLRSAVLLAGAQC